MYDEELIAIAAFNVSTAARRIIALAQSASSAKVRSGLLAIAEHLSEEERRLRTMAAQSTNSQAHKKRDAQT